MALIKCKECGKEISDKAKICVHCGAKTEKAKKQNKTIIKCIVISIIIILVILGIWFIIYKRTKKMEYLNSKYKDVLVMYGFENVEDFINSESIVMTVVFENGLDKENENKIIDKISKMDNIKSLEFKSKEQGLKDIKEELGFEYVDSLFEENAFHDLIRIKIKDSKKFSEVENEIEKIPGIEEVHSDMYKLKNEIEKDL